MDHYKHPRKNGTLPQPTITFSDSNPLCGDRITIQLVLEENCIRAARQETSGCAISQAAASMLFERIEGMTLSDVLALEKETVLEEFGTTLSVSRMKCALLAFAALKKAIIEAQTKEKG